MSFILRIFILSLLFGYSLLFGSIGRVSLLKGEASLERFGSMLSVKNGMELEEKDSIKTSKGSQIQLLFTDKTVITLGSESHFRVDEYLSEGNSPKAKFKFNQGTFKTITGRIGKSAHESFKLETRTATVGIRGTIIGGIVPVSSSPAPDTIFCFGGQITVASLLAGGVVNLPAGTITTVPLNAPPAPPRKLTPQDIAQFNESLGTPPPSGLSASQSGSDEFQSMNFDVTLPPSLSTSQEIQTSEPAAATAAQQTNLQNITQNNIVEQIQQQMISNNPIITPPPYVEPTPPPYVEPTPPPYVEPTPPPYVEPTPPPYVEPTPPPYVEPNLPPTNGPGSY